ncbi:MAG TPA: ATP-dependent 6-phosphofructokinase [Vicinamibacterales bacterium]|nr:ATP-dependent 6-phosphofructokinase [Vicinamibacterales bacterium]
MAAPIRRLGVLTGGGDAPGLNAVIRAVVKAGANANCEVIGLEDSFDGLIEPDRWRRLEPKDVTGILRVGGTILGTTNRGNPFLYPVATSEGTRDYSARCVEMFHELKLDALVVIGGDGTLAIAHRFAQMGVPLVGVPKTIDNDIVETTNTFGFDTAVSFATDAIDRLHVTAEAHHRVIVVEVMGRYAGWIALYSGVAGGADVILIPEIPYNLEAVARRIRERDDMGARFSIVVAAEGAKPVGGKATVLKEAKGEFVERLGGVASVVATQLETLTGKETRSVVLGHLQRGGTPTSFDRMLATRFGARAVELLLAGTYGHMVAFRPPDIVAVPLDRVVGRTRTVPPDFDVLRAARAIGISLGDR